jgi:hypothetical protein
VLHWVHLSAFEFHHLHNKELRYLSGIALGYGLDDRGFEPRRGLGIFLFTTESRLALWPTQLLIQ